MVERRRSHRTRALRQPVIPPQCKHKFIWCGEIIQTIRLIHLKASRRKRKNSSNNIQQQVFSILFSAHREEVLVAAAANEIGGIVRVSER